MRYNSAPGWVVSRGLGPGAMQACWLAAPALRPCTRCCRPYSKTPTTGRRWARLQWLWGGSTSRDSTLQGTAIVFGDMQPSDPKCTGVSPSSIYLSSKVCAMVQLSLIFGNLTADDILLKEELDAMAAKFPQRVKVTMSSCPASGGMICVASSSLDMLACRPRPRQP